MSLFGTWHETGHAMYEHGVGRELERTPLSQREPVWAFTKASRGCSRTCWAAHGAFWQRYFAEFAAAAPEVAAGQDAEAIYRAVNRVQPSLIRVEADEVTYNFHIMLRFELELALLEGELSVADLPAAWNAKMQELSGPDAAQRRRGRVARRPLVGGPDRLLPDLQPGQPAERATARRGPPDAGVAAGIEQADYAPLREWLRENVHQYGRRRTPGQIVQAATGQPLSADAYVKYLS